MRSLLTAAACAASALGSACSDSSVVRLEVPPGDGWLRGVFVGDGRDRPSRVWLVGADDETPPPMDSVRLETSVEVWVVDFYTLGSLASGEYEIAPEGAPAERLYARRGRRTVVTSDGLSEWTTATIPEALWVLDVRVTCPTMVPPTLPIHLPRYCPLPPEPPRDVCYGAPEPAPSMAGSVGATDVDEGLSDVVEADGAAWLYMSSNRFEVPPGSRTLPGRIRLASPDVAVPATFEPLDILPAAEDGQPLRGWVQGLQVRPDGLEMLMSATVPNDGPRRLYRAWRDRLDAPWTAHGAGYFRIDDTPAASHSAPLMLMDYRTLLFRRTYLGLSAIYATHRPGYDGDPVGPITTVPVDRSEDVVAIQSLALGCDGRHLLYAAVRLDPTDPAHPTVRRRFVEARTVEIRQLDPPVFGRPTRVPMAGGPLEANTTLGEARDCSALYVSGSTMSVARRVPCS